MTATTKMKASKGLLDPVERCILICFLQMFGQISARSRACHGTYISWKLILRSARVEQNTYFYLYFYFKQYFKSAFRICFKHTYATCSDKPSFKRSILPEQICSPWSRGTDPCLHQTNQFHNFALVLKKTGQNVYYLFNDLNFILLTFFGLFLM